MSDPTAQPAQAAPADAPRDFDFWLGSWDLTWEPDGRGTNEITAILDDRVVLEHFDGTPSMALKGVSMTIWDALIGRWRQTWLDNQGGYLDFVGGMEADRMVMSRQTAEGVWQRMVWSEIEADALNWSWERSEDGETWQVVWAIRYVRRGAGNGKAG